MFWISFAFLPWWKVKPTTTKTGNCLPRLKRFWGEKGLGLFFGKFVCVWKSPPAIRVSPSFVCAAPIFFEGGKLFSVWEGWHLDHIESSFFLFQWKGSEKIVKKVFLACLQRALSYSKVTLLLLERLLYLHTNLILCECIYLHYQEWKWRGK